MNYMFSQVPVIDKQNDMRYAFYMRRTLKTSIGNDAHKKKLNLSKYLFWDIDMRKLNYETRAPFVLERVFTMGMQEDEWKVNEYYGKERIQKEVVKCKSLDNKTINYISVFYGIPKKEFACYTKDVFQKGF